MKTILRQSERGSIVLLPFYQVCCTQEAFNPAARCAHANHRVLPFINKTESSFLGCLASQKNFEPEQIGWPVSRFFASRFEVRKNWTSSKNFFRIVRKLARWKYNKISIGRLKKRTCFKIFVRKKDTKSDSHFLKLIIGLTPRYSKMDKLDEDIVSLLLSSNSDRKRINRIFQRRESS